MPCPILNAAPFFLLDCFFPSFRRSYMPTVALPRLPPPFSCSANIYEIDDILFPDSSFDVFEVPFFSDGGP